MGRKRNQTFGQKPQHSAFTRKGCDVGASPCGRGKRGKYAKGQQWQPTHRSTLRQLPGEATSDNPRPHSHDNSAAIGDVGSDQTAAMLDVSKPSIDVAHLHDKGQKATAEQNLSRFLYVGRPMVFTPTSEYNYQSQWRQYQKGMHLFKNGQITKVSEQVGAQTNTYYYMPKTIHVEQQGSARGDVMSGHLPDDEHYWRVQTNRISETETDPAFTWSIVNAVDSIEAVWLEDLPGGGFLLIPDAFYLIRNNRPDTIYVARSDVHPLGQGAINFSYVVISAVGFSSGDIDRNTFEASSYIILQGFSDTGYQVEMLLHQGVAPDLPDAQNRQIELPAAGNWVFQVVMKRIGVAFSGIDFTGTGGVTSFSGYGCDCPYHNMAERNAHRSSLTRKGSRDWSIRPDGTRKPKPRCAHIWAAMALDGNLSQLEVPKDVPLPVKDNRMAVGSVPSIKGVNGPRTF